jgi:hypothetical protein
MRLTSMPESKTQSFLIRVWIEPREIVGTSVIWRGSAQMVSSGEQVYFKSFDELNAFIASKMSLPYFPDSQQGPLRKES